MDPRRSRPMRTFTKVAALAVAVAAMTALAVADQAGALTAPLKGLTKDNSAKVEAALTKLDRNGFRCPKCDYFSATEGECPGCGATLVADKAGPLLRDVKLDVEKGVASFGVAGPSGVRLSEIEAALKPAGVTLDEGKLAIVPFSRITLTGIESEEDGPAIAKAIEDAKLFDTVKTQVDAEHGMAVLFVGNAKTAPTYAALSEAIGKAGSFTISEVTWTSACAKCAAKGLVHQGCMSCWEKHP
jgi:hypothetical protein